MASRWEEAGSLRRHSGEPVGFAENLAWGVGRGLDGDPTLQIGVFKFSDSLMEGVDISGLRCDIKFIVLSIHACTQDLLIPAGRPGVSGVVDTLVDAIRASLARPANGLDPIAADLLLSTRVAGQRDLTSGHAPFRIPGNLCEHFQTGSIRCASRTPEKLIYMFGDGVRVKPPATVLNTGLFRLRHDTRLATLWGLGMRNPIAGTIIVAQTDIIGHSGR